MYRKITTFFLLFVLKRDEKHFSFFIEYIQLRVIYIKNTFLIVFLAFLRC